jgi:hypothetical protein
MTLRAGSFGRRLFPTSESCSPSGTVAPGACGPPTGHGARAQWRPRHARGQAGSAASRRPLRRRRQSPDPGITPYSHSPPFTIWPGNGPREVEGSRSLVSRFGQKRESDESPGGPAGARAAGWGFRPLGAALVTVAGSDPQEPQPTAQQTLGLDPGRAASESVGPGPVTGPGPATRRRELRLQVEVQSRRVPEPGRRRASLRPWPRGPLRFGTGLPPIPAASRVRVRSGH